MDKRHLLVITLGAFVVLGTGCGGSAGSTGPTLVTSDPPMNATGVSRWATVRLTFSAPIGTGSILRGSCVGNVAWKISGNEAVATHSPQYPPPLGGTCEAYGQADGADGTQGKTFSIAYTLAPAKTLIASDITVPTTLTLAGSPYLIDSSKTVYLNNTALTIEPGVDLDGNLHLLGSPSITAIGTPDSRIHIVNGGFIGNGLGPSGSPTSRFAYVELDNASESFNGSVQIEHSKIYCDPSASQGVALGTGYMTDSMLFGCHSISSSGAQFDRNIILHPTYYLMVLPSCAASFSSFTNNYVEGFGPSYSITVGDGSALGVFKGNSFINFGPKAFNGGGGCGASTRGNIDLSGNWWGTTDRPTIGTYLWDSGDDSQLPYTFVVEPILLAPDPATPTP